MVNVVYTRDNMAENSAVTSVNRIVKEFVSFALSQEGNGNFLNSVTTYLERWKNTESQGRCTFCAFVFPREGSCADTKAKIDVTKQFATRMPLNCAGVVFVWYFVLKTFCLTPVAAADIDPISVFKHLMLKTCRNDTRLSPGLSMSLMTAIKLQEDMNHVRGEAEEKSLKETAKKLRVVYSIMIEDLKKGGCYGYHKEKRSRCLYSNTGTYDSAAMNRTLDVDARFFVSAKWVKKYMPDISLKQFYGEENYMTHQPGIIKRNAEEQCARQEDVAITPMFVVEGELNPDVRSESWDSEWCAISTKKLAVELSVLHDFHRMCFDPEIGGLKCLRTTGECIWCTLSISAGARRVLHDLTLMARQKTFALGMNIGDEDGQLMTGDLSVASKFHYGTANECEEAAMKQLPTAYELRKKGRPITRSQTTASRHADPLYTLDLEYNNVHFEPVHQVFCEWAEEKYPVLHRFFQNKNMYVIDGLIDDIRCHSSSEDRVFCICNTRRVFCDTDSYMRSYHVCLLPFLFQSARTIVKILGFEKSTKILTGKLSQLTARHHMSPHLD